ncbi:MAG: ParA family protein [Actinobacteria bacterium]|nr:ParA family protein [Actinomycetota bacterium]
MKKIVFFNTKGGTGKTTLCYNYGWYLAEKRNKRILFLDFDPQVNLVQALQKKLFPRSGHNLENLIVNYIKKNDINFSDYIVKINDKIDLIPSTNNISLVEEYLTDYLIKKAYTDNKEYQALDRNLLIKEILDNYINQEGYDYIIIDSQPNYSLLSTTSLVYAENVVLVLRPEYFSFIDINYLNKIIKNLEDKFGVKINIACVIINAFEKRKRTTEKIAERFVNRYGDRFHIIKQKIRFLSCYQLSISMDKNPVFVSFPNSEASKDLLKAFREADEVIDNLHN